MPPLSIPPRYRVIEEVGQGGMAIVYRAEDATLKREVAIKVLHPHLAAEPESKARLQREAQAVAKLHHENIVEIFDYSGLDSDSSYIVTEFVDGRNLKQFMADRVLAWPTTAFLVAAEVCGALAHAHAVGIIHRDVKPENVMIRKDGLLKLMDFGIAQVLDLARMTVTGQLLGSPAYMAPELIDGKPLDVRTDVFSVGIMLYQLATGELPFSGKNPGEVLRRIADGQFVDPRARSRRISDNQRRIIARALAHRPEDRYPDVTRLLDDLRADLAACGIADARSELRAFFADPEAYEKSFPPRAATALAEAGRRAIADRKGARAMELWNRALLLEPQNVSVLASLRRMEGRRRLRTAAAVAAGVTLAIGAFFGVAQAVRPDPAVEGVLRRPAEAAPSALTAVTPASVTMPPTQASTPAAASADPGPSDARSRADDRSGPRRPPRVARTLAAAPPAEKPQADVVTYELSSSPMAVTVYLDGAPQFGYGPDHRTLDVPMDKRHTVEFRNPLYYAAKFEIDPDKRSPDKKLIGRLDPRPAELTITTDPPVSDAHCEVAYKVGARAISTPVPCGREAREVKITFGADEDLEKEVEVTALAGDVARSVKVSVRAGRSSPLTVSLPAGAKKP